MSGVESVRIDVSPGEAIDRLTILEIKLDRIADPGKRGNIAREYEALRRAHDDAVPASTEIARLTAALRGVNEDLWAVEDDIRTCEANGDFGEAFIALARSVYLTNDRRSALKRAIDQALGARFHDEKSHDLPDVGDV